MTCGRACSSANLCGIVTMAFHARDDESRHFVKSMSVEIAESLHIAHHDPLDRVPQVYDHRMADAADAAADRIAGMDPHPNLAQALQPLDLVQVRVGQQRALSRRQHDRGRDKLLDRVIFLVATVEPPSSGIRGDGPVQLGLTGRQFGVERSVAAPDAGAYLDQTGPVEGHLDLDMGGTVLNSDRIEHLAGIAHQLLLYGPLPWDDIDPGERVEDAIDIDPDGTPHVAHVMAAGPAHRVDDVLRADQVFLGDHRLVGLGEDVGPTGQPTIGRHRVVRGVTEVDAVAGRTSSRFEDDLSADRLVPAPEFPLGRYAKLLRGTQPRGPDRLDHGVLIAPRRTQRRAIGGHAETFAERVSQFNADLTTGHDGDRFVFVELSQRLLDRAGVHDVDEVVAEAGRRPVKRWDLHRALHPDASISGFPKMGRQAPGGRVIIHDHYVSDD